MPRPSARTRTSSPATACGPAWPPRPRPAAPPSATSCNRPATAASRWSAATSARASFFQRPTRSDLPAFSPGSTSAYNARSRLGLSGKRFGNVHLLERQNALRAGVELLIMQQDQVYQLGTGDKAQVALATGELQAGGVNV